MRKPQIIVKFKIIATGYFYRALGLNKIKFSTINIAGNKRTTNAEIIAIVKNFEMNNLALNSQQNLSADLMPIIQNLIDEIKIKLPWVDKITIKRTMPDIINIEIEEYQPFAIWFDENSKYIIDKDGNSIPFLESYEDNEEFKNMIILSGKGANKNAKSLFNILAINSKISQDIYSANWVGNRRWDIRFYDGLIAKLPEVEISKAWDDLINLYLKVKEDKSLKLIDLRINGKIYLKYHDNKSTEIKSIKS